MTLCGLLILLKVLINDSSVRCGIPERNKFREGSERGEEKGKLVNR
jgi:hypothetical protein